MIDSERLQGIVPNLIGKSGGALWLKIGEKLAKNIEENRGIALGHTRLTTFPLSENCVYTNLFTPSGVHLSSSHKFPSSMQT
jgi:hypothetical protein